MTEALPSAFSNRSELTIEGDEDIVRVRSRVRDVARTGLLDAFSTCAVMTAASELARDVLSRAGNGTAVVERLEDESGVRIVFHDAEGDLPVRVRRVAPLVDELAINSTWGEGTTMIIVKRNP